MLTDVWTELATDILGQAIKDARIVPRCPEQNGMETLRQSRDATRGWLERWCDVLDAKAFIRGESEPAWLDTLCSSVGIEPDVFIERARKIGVHRSL